VPTLRETARNAERPHLKLRLTQSNVGPLLNGHVVQADQRMLRAGAVDESRLSQYFGSRVERTIPPRTFAGKVLDKTAAGHKRLKRQPLYRLAHPTGDPVVEPSRPVQRADRQTFSAPSGAKVTAAVLGARAVDIYTHRAAPKPLLPAFDTRRVVSLANDPQAVNHVFQKKGY